MLGKSFYNFGLEEKMAKTFHDMSYDFSYPIPPLGKNSTFTFDYRMTEDAVISGGKMDLFFLANIAPIG